MAALPLDGRDRRRTAAVELIVDQQHYDQVVLRALTQARVSLWIATANLKDVRLEAPLGSVARARGRYVSIVETFASLSGRGVEVRVLHATPPSRPFRQSLAKRRSLKPPRFELRACPRVHLKMIAVDGEYLYVGSANFTGAGLGARGAGKRNFEMGLATADDLLLDAAQERFDRIWSGKECGACKLRSLCPKPLDGKGK
ncbi:MAG TPA: phospholipase D family protein [Polyangiaceae bacterium]|nr:phospholipase D family protein [Polyangiaceae bacterium]